MSEQESEISSGAVPSREDETAPGGAGDEQRELLLMRAGGYAFAVYADEAETVTPWSRPTPLPHAPAVVLGVVSVRGRMRTVLDSARLLGAGGPARESESHEHQFIASLRGDEQLALAFEHAERFFADAASLAPAAADALPVLGAFRRGEEPVYLLDTARLFDAATRGTDRRRRRLAP